MILEIIIVALIVIIMAKYLNISFMLAGAYAVYRGQFPLGAALLVIALLITPKVK